MQVHLVGTAAPQEVQVDVGVEPSLTGKEDTAADMVVVVVVVVGPCTHMVYNTAGTGPENVVAKQGMLALSYLVLAAVPVAVVAACLNPLCYH